jgi:exonuclease SbcC
MLTEVARVRPLRDQAAVTAARLDEAVRQRDAAREALRDLDARAVGLPEELRSLAPEVAAAREAALHVESLTTAVEALRVRIRAAESLEEIDARLTESEHALAEVTAARLTAREELLDIRERRLDGMAAEIAGRLAVGACCPVCGSAEHPAPAAPAPGAPDDAAEREARRVVDDLEAVVEAHAQQVRGLEARRAAAEAEAGGTLDQLGTELADALTRLDDARRLAATADGLQTRIAALEQEQSRLTDAREAGAARAAAIDTEVAVLAAQLDDLERRVAEVAPDGADLEALAAHHRDVEAAAARCLEAAADLDRARTASEQASSRLELAAQEAGFDSPETAAEAWVPVDDLEALRAAVERHERDVARVEELLTDPELVRAAAADAPDLDALDRALQQARATLAAVRTRHAGHVEQERRLRALVGQVTSAVAAWVPLRDELDLVADLAAMVEGKHPDNRLRMRLSAYVLSHRLGQVVEAANLRLSTMSDQRYSLVHTGQRGAGETRGGLSLLVRDDWTGDSRDPATLSGGETFVVSLALALGLADVITEEAGGADLDTLFVDEGFGSLDADTLEDVMDTLDALRDGGRVVGVVSHVPELQNRIPTQLRVHRGRHGSRISLRAG